VLGDPRRAAIVAIGDELQSGATIDTNSAWIAGELLDLGIEPERFVVVGDDEARLERLFWQLTQEFQVVVATGGLGPTLDDVTRHAAARAAGEALVLDKDVEAKLRAYWRSRGGEMPAANVRQALFPQGAQVMPNAVGTAPGFRVWIDGGMLACLPGPPREMHRMMRDDLLPYLAHVCGAGERPSSRRLYLTGLSESVFAERCGDWMDRRANPRIGVCAHEGVLTVRLRAQAGTAEAAERLLDARLVALRETFAAHVFSEHEGDLARVVGELLIERGVSVALAESCTGGLLGARLTEVAGISAVLREGWITYTNEAKRRRLGVSLATLDRHGAVSSEVAAEMALGAARESGARLAVSVTGIAGPAGGSPDKPVGLVWFGVALDGAVETHEWRFPPHGGRAWVRALAVNTALDRMRRRVLAAGA